MADDLGEEWWLEENTENTGINCYKKTQATKEKVALTEVSKKRDRTKSEGKTAQNEKSTPKPKKKKKSIKQTIEKTINGEDIPEIFWSSFYKSVKGKLSALELDDIKVEDEMFITDKLQHSGELKNLSVYIKSALPKWSKLVERLDTRCLKGSPILLLVTSAATRTTDIVRALKDFKQNERIVKLFSKHIKLEEQEKYLGDHVVHIGVGTPNRIYKLIQSGSLNLSHLKAVILDWTWRDAKQRRLMDIPEIQQDLVVLLKDVVLVMASEHKTKIGLF